MPTVVLSTRLTLHSADWPTTGTVRITAAQQKARMEQAIARMTVDPDDYLTAACDVFYLPAGGTGGGETAWGKSYAAAGGNPRKINIAPGNPPNTSSLEQQYTLIHEIAHKVDKDKLNPTTRASIMALMSPVPPGSGGAKARWQGGEYEATPSEIFAHTFVKAYSDIQNTLEPPGWHWDRAIADLAAFRAIVDAAGSPSDSPDEPPPIDPPPLDAVPLASPGNQLSVLITPNDQDAGDKMTGAKMEVYAGGTTQAQINAGAVPVKTVQQLWTSSPFPTSVILTATGLSPGRYVHREATRDKGNDSAVQSTWEWGPWTAAVEVEIGWKPGGVGNLAIDLETLVISGTMIHQDPAATIAKVRVVVQRRNPTTGVVTPMWDTWVEGGGVTGGTGFLIPYNGADLAPGLGYELNAQVEDNKGKVGPLLGSWLLFVVGTGEVLGPATMSPRSTATKVNRRDPPLTIGDDQAFDAYELEVANEPLGAGGLAWDGAVVNHSSTTSRVVTWAAPALLAWAQRPSWRAKIRNTASGTWTDWSPWQPFAINAQPETPLFWIRDQDDNWVLLSAITSHTARGIQADFQFIYNDPDRDIYGETPVWRDVLVRNADASDRARIVRRLYGYEDEMRPGIIDAFDQPGTLTPTEAGWVAGTSSSLEWVGSGPFPIRGQCLRIAIVGLAQNTDSYQTKTASLVKDGLYTDLSDLTAFHINVRSSAFPTGLVVALQFQFNGSWSNYAEFNITPANSGWHERDEVFASPDASANVDWAHVSAYRLRIRHANASPQTINVYLDDFWAEIFALDRGYLLSGRYMDSNTEGVWGAPSHGGQEVQLFAALPPIVVPAVVEDNDPTATVNWTLSRGDQASYLVEIIDHASGGVIDDSGWLEGEPLGYPIPPGRLLNARKYRARITVLSPNGLIGTADSAIWTTAFTQLSALTGAEVTPDATHGIVHIAFTPSSATYFYSYRLFVSYPGVDRELVAEWFDKAVGEVDDWSPPSGVPLTYELTQYDGWLDSAPVVVSAQIGDEPDWYLGVPNNLTLSFPITVQTPFNRAEEARMAAKWALGRSTPLVRADATSSPAGDFAIHIPPNDHSSIELIRTVARESRKLPFVYLKTALGESLKVKLGTVKESYAEGGKATLQIPFTTVVWKPPVISLVAEEEIINNPLLVDAVEWQADPA